jgi:hypothetical protein
MAGFIRAVSAIDVAWVRHRTFAWAPSPAASVLVLALSSAVALTALLVTPAPSPAERAQPRLTFGIYPGGTAGAVGARGVAKPEDPAKRLRAIERLRGSKRRFVVHLYAHYTGPASASVGSQVGNDIATYTAKGFQVELVICYRPVNRDPAADVPGFESFVRSAVRALGRNRRFVSLQVTNEANVRGSPDAADGDFPGAADALIRGVIAAKRATRRGGAGHLKIGFNWAYDLGPREADFWSNLRGRGGRRFVRSLDWVGLDVYPGTWGPPLDPTVPFAHGVRKTMIQALRALRVRYMPLAAIPRSVPIHVSENGYPTGPGRTERRQSVATSAAIAAVNRSRAAYNVTDYRWFDLRDADSSSPSFEGRYGIMRDDYSPKAAFSVYRRLISSLG